MKVLVVDDQEKMLRIYKNFLTQEGHEVIEANESHLALDQLIIQKDIPLILLDLHMPEVDGVTLYEAVKEYDPKMKVIVTSVYPIDLQKRLVAGADDYFDKSDGMPALMAKIKKVVQDVNESALNLQGGNDHEKVPVKP